MIIILSLITSLLLVHTKGRVNIYFEIKFCNGSSWFVIINHNRKVYYQHPAFGALFKTLELVVDSLAWSGKRIIVSDIRLIGPGLRCESKWCTIVFNNSTTWNGDGKIEHFWEYQFNVIRIGNYFLTLDTPFHNYF